MITNWLLSKKRKLYGVVIFVTSSLLLRTIWHHLHRRYKNYPPGPVGLPFIGSLIQLNNYKYFAYLANCYGSIFMVNAGLSKFIFLNDLEIVTKTLSQKTFSNRVFFDDPDYPSIASVNGQEMFLRRKMFLKSFTGKLNGSYLNKLSLKILKNHLFKTLDECITQQKPFVLETIRYTVHCFIHSALFGKYIIIPNINDNDYKTLMKYALSRARPFLFIMIISVVFGTSFISQLIIRNTIGRQFTENTKLLTNHFTTLLNKFENEYNINNEYTEDDANWDYNACIITWIKQYKKGIISKNIALSDIRDMFIGGIYTTTNKIKKGILLLAKYENVQQRIYNEIKQFSDNNDINILHNINKLHILRAAVHEILRYEQNPRSISMLARTVIDDNLTINGYNIPKNVQIVSFNSYISRNKKYFNNPDNFDIDNFLDDSDKFKNNNGFSSFGHGRRSCPGMALAKRMLYIIIGKMILNYKFYAKHDVDLSNITNYDLSTDHIYVYKRK